MYNFKWSSVGPCLHYRGRSSSLLTCRSLLGILWYVLYIRHLSGYFYFHKNCCKHPSGLAKSEQSLKLTAELSKFHLLPIFQQMQPIKHVCYVLQLFRHASVYQGAIKDFLKCRQKSDSVLLQKQFWRPNLLPLLFTNLKDRCDRLVCDATRNNVVIMPKIRADIQC